MMPLTINGMIMYEIDGDYKYQLHSYIESGWYILESVGRFFVYEIPECGGEEQLIKNVSSFGEAIKIATALS